MRNLIKYINFFKEIPVKEKVTLLTILLISFLINLYNVITFPIFLDEAWTYLNFTEKGFLYSISKYPAPNNHILHSILTLLTKDLPFGTTINLRIPNLILATIASLLFFVTFSKLFSKKIALYLLLLFCFTFVFMHYAYLSRGYMLVIVSFIVCFYATIRLCSLDNTTKKDLKYYVLLSLASIIGFYTMPSFLYAYFTCVSFLFFYFLKFKNIHQLKQLLIFGIVTTFIVLLLYTPVFIVSGIDSVINNRFVEPSSIWFVLKGIPGHFKETLGFLIGIKFYYIMPIYLYGFYLLLKNKSIVSYFVLYCFAIAPVILVFHSLIPYYRVWVYLLIPIMYLFGVIFNNLNLSNNKMNIIIGIISLGFIFNFYQKIKYEQQFSFSTNEVANKLIEIKAENVVVFKNFIDTNLIYLFKQKNINIKTKYVDSHYLNNYYMKSKDYFITSKKLDLNSKYKNIHTWYCWELDIYLYQMK